MYKMHYTSITFSVNCIAEYPCRTLAKETPGVLNII